MARIRDPARDEAKKMYLDSEGQITNREIANTLGVDEKKIATWKSRDNWNDCSKENVVQQNEKCSTTNEKQKIDWQKLETEYVTDISAKPITLKGLSEKHGVSFKTIQDYSTKNTWSDKRKSYQGNVKEKTREKLAERDSDILAEAMLNLNQGLLQASKELNIYEEINFGEVVYKELETVRTAKLNGLIKSAALLKGLDLTREKLEIERLKVSPGNEEKEIVIINQFLRSEDGES